MNKVGTIRNLFLLTHHHVNEFIVVNLSVSVDVGFPDHLVDLLVSEFFTEIGHDVTELSRADESVAVLVENLEGFLDLLC